MRRRLIPPPNNSLNRSILLNPCLLSPAVLKAWAAESNPVLRFGLITDVLQDIIPDAEQRIRLFGVERAVPEFQTGRSGSPSPQKL